MTVRIVLACAGGYSTSMLVERMKQAAKVKNIDAAIDAVAESSIPKAVETHGIDVLLLGPQMGHAEEGLKLRYAAQFPIEIIDMIDYGMMDGEKVLARALNLVEKT